MIRIAITAFLLLSGIDVWGNEVFIVSEAERQYQTEFENAAYEGMLKRGLLEAAMKEDGLTWSYPRKIDTRLCAFALVFHRAEIAQSGVSSLSVIKHFNVLEDSGFSRRNRLETLGVDQFYLEATEERFHGRIVPTISLAAHARHTAP